MIKVKVKYLRDIKPVQFYDKGDWIDLRSGEDLILQPGQYYEIPLGIAAELPAGFSAIIASESLMKVTAGTLTSGFFPPWP